MSGKARGSGGGKAMGGGGDFQARVGAWLMTHMLAEEESEPPFALTVPLASVAGETAGPVDDVVAGTVDGHAAYLQAKRTVTLEKKRIDSKGKLKPFPSAVDQFVRQFLQRRDAARNGQGDPLDPSHDRLVLGVGEGAPGTVKETLRGVLERIHIQPAGTPLRGPGLSEAECGALDTLLTHVRASWAACAGSDPQETEVHEFLRLVRVEVIAVEGGQPAEREAKTMLRTSVLEDPSQAEQAWTALVRIGARLITTGSTIGRDELVRELLLAKIRLRAPRSYRGDIERLKLRSGEVSARLEEFSRIDLAGTRVRISRAYTQTVRAAAEDGPLLIVGKPGVGKSGVTHEGVEELRREGRDVLVIAAQDISATSLGNLRADLGLTHDLADVLANWPGSDPAFLVVDALDASRDESARRTLLELIRTVIRSRGRWHVVASVREYDLRYGIDLRDLFVGDPPAGPAPSLPGPEMRRVRHLVISDLTDDELTQIGAQSIPLHGLIVSAPPPLHELLRNPFNLGLAAKLLEGGADPDAIRALRTQIDLLDAYWERRVIGGGEPLRREGRRTVLRRVAESMVQRRSLRVDRHVAAEAAESAALSELLNAHVLVEWQRNARQVPDESVLAFNHHVLFDYAVERVYLRGTTPISERLAEDPQLILFARPSLVMHFQHLWDSDSERRSFWEATLDAASNPRVRETAKLVGPGVAAERAESISDLDPLLEARESADADLRNVADATLLQLVRSLLPGAGGQRPVSGPDAGPWASLLERVSRQLTRTAAFAVATTIDSHAVQQTAATDEQRQQLGAAARRLLEFAWEDSPRNSSLVRAALAAVCRYIDTDQNASSSLIRRALKCEHLLRHGHEELRVLGDAVPTLVKFDRVLVRDLYTRAFAAEVTDKSATSFGGVVMPLGSNVAQDYSMGLYVLGKNFPALLRAAPAHALGAVVRVMRARARQKAPSASRAQVVAFAFGGVPARVRQDRSSVWASSLAHTGDDATKLLGALLARLRSLAEREGSGPRLRRWVHAIARRNELAVIWSRIMRLGAQFPDTLGAELKPLIFAKPILEGRDTNRAARELITALAASLTDEERAEFERIVLEIDEPKGGESFWRPHTRARLLHCLAPWRPRSVEALELLAELEAFGVPDDGDVLGGVRMRRIHHSDDENLSAQGVALEHPANRALLDLVAPVEKVSGAADAAEPDSAPPHGALAALQNLHRSLSNAEKEGVHPVLREHARDALLKAAEELSALSTVTCAEALGSFVRLLLLEGAQDERPRLDKDAEPIDDIPSLVSSAPRGRAAAGLLRLACDASCSDSAVLEKVNTLSADPVARVRLSVAADLWMLGHSTPDRMWSLIEGRASAEESPGVLGAIAQTVGRVWRSDPVRAASIVIALSRRLEQHEGAVHARGACVNILALIYVRSGEKAAHERLLAIAGAPLAHPSEARHLARAFHHGMLTQGPLDPPDPEDEIARGRCIEIFSAIVSAAGPEFRKLVAENLPEPGPERVQREERLRALVEVLDTAASEVFFASGAHKDGENPPTAEQQRRFYRELTPVLAELALIGVPRLAHHVLEVLEQMLPFDPVGVFAHIAATVRAASQAGYQYDHMGEDLLVRLVERYLADHRAVFQEDEQARAALLEVLDIFVSAGSTSAQRLAYSLGDIFR